MRKHSVPSMVLRPATARHATAKCHTDSEIRIREKRDLDHLIRDWARGFAGKISPWEFSPGWRMEGGGVGGRAGGSGEGRWKRSERRGGICAGVCVVRGRWAGGSDGRRRRSRPERHMKGSTRTQERRRRPLGSRGPNLRVYAHGNKSFAL